MANDSPYVSRAGLKLEHALRAFALDVTDLRCADFGCNVGGFTDCLLQHGAARVIAIDTGYGTLAYRLRQDPRVETRERTNALHADPPPEGVDLITIDLAWTPQRHAIPAALNWLSPAPGIAAAPAIAPGPGIAPGPRADDRIITLVKPHYELNDAEKRELLRNGALDPVEAERVLHRVLEAMPSLGAEVLAWTQSPLTGRKSQRKAGGKGKRGALLPPGQVGPGNIEFLALLRASDRRLSGTREGEIPPPAFGGTDPGRASV